MTAKQLTALINMAFEAVNASVVGPIYGTDAEGKTTLNGVAYNTYLYVITNIIPKASTGNFTVEEPREDWQGE
jgi:hypothetical protein